MEAEVTWNRKPAFGQKLDTASFDTAAGWKAFVVTSFVQSELSGDGIISIGIDTVDNRYASMNSREAVEHRPYLQVLSSGMMRRRRSRPMMPMRSGTERPGR